MILDLRPDSPSFGRGLGADLGAANRMMMYVPRGFAHAFATLMDDTETLYLVSALYVPQQERGLRYDAPWIGVERPVQPTEVSAKNATCPHFDPVFHGTDSLRGLRLRQPSTQ